MPNTILPAAWKLLAGWALAFSLAIGLRGSRRLPAAREALIPRAC